MRKPFLQPQQTSTSLNRQVMTVTQLNKKTKNLIESELGSVWLEGEISNFIQAASGHWYFSLKDSNAQIKCAIFKFKNRLVNMSPKEGDKVVVKGKVSLYEARGDYQMIADYMEPAGLGKLQQELNQLIKKLELQGLFSAENKKPLPFLPKAIGLVTSPSGAAVHDVIAVLQRRCPMVPIIIYPTQVQGKLAANNIILALEQAKKHNQCDVILMTRGGGSLEDLWSFNDEKLAYFIADYNLPIVAAIGHEVDVTVTELVADLRAATPSAAAELIAPDQQSLWQRLDIAKQALSDEIHHQLNQLQTRLNIARLRMKAPEHQLLQLSNQLHLQQRQLQQSFLQQLNVKNNQLLKLSKALTNLHPKEKLIRNKHNLEKISSRLLAVMQKITQQKTTQFMLLTNKLDTLSPLSTLSRGYSISRDKKSLNVINKVSQVTKGQTLSIILSDGEIDCQVK